MLWREKEGLTSMSNMHTHAHVTMPGGCHGNTVSCQQQLTLNESTVGLRDLQKPPSASHGGGVEVRQSLSVGTRPWQHSLFVYALCQDTASSQLPLSQLTPRGQQTTTNQHPSLLPFFSLNINMIFFFYYA